MSLDPYYNNVVGLWNCEEVNGATTIRDHSLFRQNLTCHASAGTTPSVSTAQAKFGLSSVSFAGDNLGFCDTPVSNVYGFGTGDWTIEGWFYANASPPASQYFCSTNYVSGGPTIDVRDVGHILQFVDGAHLAIVGTTTITDQVWHHFAISRVGTTIYLFLDGNLEGSVLANGAASFNDYGATGRAAFGNQLADTNEVLGFLDDMRITKGVGRYSANFAVPTSAFPFDVIATSIYMDGPRYFSDRRVRRKRI